MHKNFAEFERSQIVESNVSVTEIEEQIRFLCTINVSNTQLLLN